MTGPVICTCNSAGEYGPQPGLYPGALATLRASCAEHEGRPIINTIAELAAPTWSDAFPAATKPKKWLLTNWQERRLRESYDSRPETITLLTREFGLPRWVIRKWAAELGLARTKEPFWTPEAEAYLRAHFHLDRAATIARRLGRTVTAVTLKAKRLEISKGGPGYTLRQLSLAVGEDHHKIRRWVESGALKARRRNTERSAIQGGDMWLFTDRDIREFMRRYPLEISLKKVDQLWFIEHMLGILVTA